MTLSEFKAWFEGYTEGLEGAPTKAQFERIKERVKEINGAPITNTVYVDRWISPYRQYWQTYDSAYPVGGWAQSGNIQASTTALSQGYNTADADAQTYAGVGAMYEAGKAEASAA
jgi:hypothetical protein